MEFKAGLKSPFITLKKITPTANAEANSYIVYFDTSGDLRKKDSSGNVTLVNAGVGPQGDKGEIGQKGDAGYIGADGAKGSNGDKGNTGDQGPTGSKGDVGQKGDQGDKGEKGLDGNSSGILLYLNYSQDNSPYKTLSDNYTNNGLSLITTSLSTNVSNVLLGEFMTNFTLPKVLSNGYWDLNLFANANGNQVHIYTSIFKRDVSNVETLIASNNSAPIAINFVGVEQYEIPLLVPYTNLVSTDKLVYRIYANNDANQPRAIDTYFEDSYYSHIHSTINARQITGDKGDQGATGASGSNGQKGDQGDKGNTGDKGDVGQKGDQGTTGTTGTAGAKGDKGNIGDQGPAGPNVYTGIASNITPDADNSRNLGAVATRFANLYVVNSFVGDLIFMNDWKITEFDSMKILQEDYIRVIDNNSEEILRIHKSDGIFYKGQKITG